MSTASLDLKLQTDLFIDGEFVPSVSGRRFATTNPATDEAIADVAEAGREDLDRAVSGARKAFEGGPWAAMKPRQRTHSDSFFVSP
jgi:acyl-CoA reductase-like NAD-dependent aldehyde dehydrogenase